MRPHISDDLLAIVLKAIAPPSSTFGGVNHRNAATKRYEKEYQRFAAALQSSIDNPMEISEPPLPDLNAFPPTNDLLSTLDD